MTRATEFIERLIAEARPLDASAVDEWVDTLTYGETRPLLREAGRHALSRAAADRDASGDPLMIPVISVNAKGRLYCPSQHKVPWVVATSGELILYARFLQQQATATDRAAALTSAAAKQRAALIARLEAEAARREETES